MLKKTLFAALACALVSACASTKPVALGYVAAPSAQKFDAGASLGVGQVTDQRGNGTNWIGAIRGGYGNPLKVLETEKPVSEVVADTFRNALAARGISSNENASHKLAITLNTLSSSQYQRREAHVDMQANVVETATGNTVYTTNGKSDLVNGSVMALNTGIMADPEKLRELVNDALIQAVDQILDDPKLHALLRGK